jgi:hypothetical protein
MPALKLLAKIIIYYGAVIALLVGVIWLFPGVRDYLPIGRAEALITGAGDSLEKAQAGIRLAHVDSFAESLVWLVTAILGSLAAALPVSWVYMEIREPHDCDQSLVDTIVVLPMVVTSIVVIVQHSLALSFSLAGIAGAARFRNNLKDSGDLLFILLAIGLGLAAGIGALELALVTSLAFNLCFFGLWCTGFGEHKVRKHYLHGLAVAPASAHANGAHKDAEPPGPDQATAAAGASEGSS